MRSRFQVCWFDRGKLSKLAQRLYPERVVSAAGHFPESIDSASKCLGYFTSSTRISDSPNVLQSFTYENVLVNEAARTNDRCGGTGFKFRGHFAGFVKTDRKGMERSRNECN
jgi:hypothetical protein